MIPFLSPGAPFPPVARALRRPNGLLAAGGDLSVDTLIRAYAAGIFPWYSEGDPVLWWSPDPRMVLFTAEFHVSRSLARRLTRDVPRDDGRGVRGRARARAAPRDEEGGTWLMPEMQAAHVALHERGPAHRWRSGTETSSPAASTAWRSGGCSTASRCSRAGPTARRWRWRGWRRSARAGVAAHRLPDEHAAPGVARRPRGAAPLVHQPGGCWRARPGRDAGRLTKTRAGRRRQKE